MRDERGPIEFIEGENGEEMTVSCDGSATVNGKRLSRRQAMEWYLQQVVHPAYRPFLRISLLDENERRRE